MNSDKTPHSSNFSRLDDAQSFKLFYRYPSIAKDRCIKSVHGDVHALLDAGVIQRTENGEIVFPYDAVHVDFMLTSAA